MVRIIVCLGFLLFFGFLYPRPDLEGPGLKPDLYEHEFSTFQSDWVTLISCPGNCGFPGSVPWVGIARTFTGEGAPEPLPYPDIITFLEKGIARYDKEIQGYQGILDKQERVNGKLGKHEIVEIHFKENPHSVYMKWKKGARLRIKEALYVKGQNNDNLLAKFDYFVSYKILQKPVDGPEAKQSARYTIAEFGIKKGMERLLRDWRKVQKEGRLNVKYDGIYRVADCGNRLCYKIHRPLFSPPENDGIAEIILFIDRETWLQTGTILLDSNGELVARYFFRDLEFNPDFPPDHFTRELMMKK